MVPSPADHKTTLVIVDDDAAFRYTLERSLDLQYEILASVGDGVAGIDAVQQHRPNIVLLDISMPVMNGLDAAEQIVKDCPSVFIIFVTAHTERAYVDEAFRRGAAGYVTKGNVKELQVAITQVLNGRHHRPEFGH